MLAKIVELVYDGNYSFCLLADFQYWDMEDAKGIPNYGTRYGLFFNGSWSYNNSIKN
jgi:hypothetical protein